MHTILYRPGSGIRSGFPEARAHSDRASPLSSWNGEHVGVSAIKQGHVQLPIVPCLIADLLL